MNSLDRDKFPVPDLDGAGDGAFIAGDEWVIFGAGAITPGEVCIRSTDGDEGEGVTDGDGEVLVGSAADGETA